jgi:hypothetical protein
MTLQQIGERYGTDKAIHHKYLDFYQKHLPKRTFGGRLLEIGVMDGASIQMWRDYYPKAEIVGIDIMPKDHLQYSDVQILKIDATDIEALKELGNFDIIIDDGSHYTLDQQISFYWLYYNQLNKNGYYILEDLHTSLLPRYVNSRYTTLEMLDRLKLEVSHFRNADNKDDSMTAIIRAGQ